METRVYDDSDEEEAQHQMNKQDSFSKKIQIEINLLPPLLPLKFGNGLLLQYIVNHPGEDDHLYLLEVGLVTGRTSLTLVLLTTMVNYLLKSAPTLLKRKEKVGNLTGLAMHFNHLVMMLQVLLLLVIFFYTVSLYSKVDFNDKHSPYYVKERIYVFSLLISSIMFFSTLVVTIIMLALFLHKPPQPSSNSPEAVSILPHPAYSVLPLGLANALLGLYIGIPGDDQSIVGPKVLLLDLCLWIGAITVLMTVMESVIKVALTVALRDGHLDVKEATLLKYMQLLRYLMAMLQVLMFFVMFCHSVEVFLGEGDSDYTCPRNLIMISLILSSIILMAGVIALVMAFYLKFC